MDVHDSIFQNGVHEIVHEKMTYWWHAMIL